MVYSYLVRCWLMLIYYSSFVNTQMKPTIHPTEIQVLVGDNAIFECSTSSTPSDEKWWWWFKVFSHSTITIANEQGFSNTKYELNIDDDRKKSTLTILNITEEDGEVQYYCQYGIISTNATLIAITGTKLDSKYPQCQSDNSVVNTNSNLTLTCSASGGNPRPELQWYKNGNKVTEQDNVPSSLDESYSVEELTYLLTSEDERAIFTCNAEGVAATVNQNCSITLTIPPTVTIITNTTSFAVGDSLELTCTVMSPWNITLYTWNYGDQPVKQSTKFKLNSDNTELTILNLQSEDDEKEVECTAVTSSGLTGNDSVIITIYDSKEEEEKKNSTLLIILIVAGAVVLILLVCLAMCILCQNRKRKGRRENRNKNVTSSYYDNVLTEQATSIHSYERRIDITARDENEGTVSYVNTLDTFGSRPSGTFVGFDKDQEGTATNEDDIDALYAQPVKSKASVAGLPTDFGELYAKPMKGIKSEVSNPNEEVEDFGELYAKPNKSKTVHLNTMTRK
ncbi:uncharacterized protein [Antedon mediterranea]|uniref:uncharacterized protein n=1 Tax=Antedon mediterranea TaxID=105859 RepID=UPI003AF7BF7A